MYRPTRTTKGHAYLLYVENTTAPLVVELACENDLLDIREQGVRRTARRRRSSMTTARWARNSTQSGAATYHFCAVESHTNAIAIFCRNYGEEPNFEIAYFGDREIILGKLAWHQEKNCPPTIEKDFPYYTYEPYALLVTKNRPTWSSSSSGASTRIFSDRSEAVSLFTEHFPGVRMSPVLADLFLLNAVDQFEVLPQLASRGRPGAARLRLGGTGRRQELTPRAALTTRAPKSAEPMRTWVAPQAMAASKSSLMPIDRPARPWRAASARSSCEVRRRVGVDRRDRHQAEDRQVVGRGRRRGSASRPSGSTPAFCGSRPVLTWTKSVGQAPRACTAVGELAGEAVAVEAVDRVEERRARGRACWSAAGRRGAARTPGNAGAERRPALLGLLHPVLAEDALAGVEHGARPASAGCTLETATSVTDAGRAAGAGEWRRRCGPRFLERHGRDHSGGRREAERGARLPFRRRSELHGDAEVGDRRALVVGRRRSSSSWRCRR